MTTSLKQRQEMQSRLGEYLADTGMREQAQKDFTYTLKVLGMQDAQAQELSGTVLDKLKDTSRPLADVEREVFNIVETTAFTDANGEQTNLHNKLEKTLIERAGKIAGGISDYLKDMTGNGLDFGAGSGRITSLIAKSLREGGWSGAMSAVDIQDYRTPDTVATGLVDFHLFDGKKVNVDPAAFEFAIATHVLHHGEPSDDLVKELSRVVRKRIAVLEIVPRGTTPEEIAQDKKRMFIVDYLYSRVLHDPVAADIPVPGSFETGEGWAEKFKKEGWKVKESKNIDIPNAMLPVQQHRLILER